MKCALKLKNTNFKDFSFLLGCELFALLSYHVDILGKSVLCDAMVKLEQVGYDFKITA